MRFVHTADNHIDMPLSYLRGDKSLARKLERRSSFSKIIDYTIKNADFLLISGDLFHTPSPSASTLSFCKEQFSRMGDIPVFIALGNHDYSVDLSDFPGNVHVFPPRFTTFTYKGIAITGASFSSSEALLSPPYAQKDGFNILCLHGDLFAASGYNPLNKDFISSLGYNYTALGHIHTYYKDSSIAYPGCHDGAGFDETGDKGFICVNMENGILHSEFISSSSRIYEEIDLDISSFTSSYEIISALSSLSAENLYKVNLTGHISHSFFPNLDYLSASLSEKLFYVRFYDKTTVEKDIAGTALVSLFTDYLSAYDENVSSLAYKYGIAALKGEDFEI